MGLARNGTLGPEMGWARNGTGTKWDGHEMGRAWNGSARNGRHEMGVISNLEFDQNKNDFSQFWVTYHWTNSHFSILSKTQQYSMILSNSYLLHGPIKIYPSGNTFWHFLAFKWTFVHSKCKRSSLCSWCWMRLFGRFSNTVYSYPAVVNNT